MLKKIIIINLLFVVLAIRPSNKVHPDDQKFLSIISSNNVHPDDQNKLNNVFNVVPLSRYATLPTLYNSYELAIECIKNNIPGDFVECGVAAGAQIAAMSYACDRLDSNRKIHLFDSFEGIPLAGIHDTQQPGIGEITHAVDKENSNALLISSGIAMHSLESVKRNMAIWEVNFDRLVFYKGWFQHTLPARAHEIKNISLLRLDGDLYESTKVCLEYLYPKVSKGGYVIIDDFGSLSGCKKAVLEYLDQHHIRADIIEISGGLGPIYWQVQ